MSNIRAAPSEIHPADSRASIDTIEVFARWLPRGFRRQVEAITGERLMVEQIRHGVMVKLNRPPLGVLSILDGLIKNRRHGACVSRVDFAYDFTMASEDAADQLTDWIDRHVVLKWRSRRTRKREYRGTIYWADKHKGRNISLYRKRTNVVRLELRFYRAQTVKRAGLDDLTKLAHVDPKLLFNHHVKGRRLSEKFKVNAMRKAVKEDRARTKEKPGCNQFIDAYRSKIGKRVHSILSRVDGQSLGLNGREDVDLAFLRIPDCLSWPALKTKDNLEGSGKAGGYYGKAPETGHRKPTFADQYHAMVEEAESRRNKQSIVD